MVFTLDSRKLYVDSWSGKIVSINTATNTMGKSIPLAGMALSPNGRKLYIADGDTLTPVSTATDKAGQPIRFPMAVGNVGIGPHGRTAYVSQAPPGMVGPGTVFPVNLVADKILAPINLPGGVMSMLIGFPTGIAFFRW